MNVKRLDVITQQVANTSVESAGAKLRGLFGSLLKHGGESAREKPTTEEDQGEWARIYTVWARGRLQVGDLDGAIYYFQSALLHDPGNEDIRKMLLTCLRSAR